MEKWVVEARSHFLASVRKFFSDRGYLEAPTPNLVRAPGTEVHLRYFQTEWIDHQRKVHPLFLRSSPELAMKKLLVAGCERIYQIAPCYRNVGEYGAWHRPEFLMLEFYNVGQSPDACIQETFELLKTTSSAMSALVAKRSWPAKSRTMPESFQRFSVKEAFKQFAHIELADNDSLLAEKAIQSGVQSVQKSDDFETAFFKVLLEKIEPALQKIPVAVLVDYPPSQAALARIERGVAKRFEFYIDGVELSNGFFELQDPSENQKRFELAMESRRRMGYEVFGVDQSFQNALRKGLPECSGNALGLDRWFALLLGKSDLGILDQDIFDGT